MQLLRVVQSPTEFEIWLNLLQNGTRRNLRTVMFNNVKKGIAWRMKEMCNEKSFCSSILTFIKWSC